MIPVSEADADMAMGLSSLRLASRSPNAPRPSLPDLSSGTSHGTIAPSERCEACGGFLLHSWPELGIFFGTDRITPQASILP